MKIEALVEDSFHLTLLDPVDFPAGRQITVDLNPSAVMDARRVYLESAAVSLERAYGEDEPDYSESGEPLDTE